MYVGSEILHNASELLPKYYSIYSYLEGDNCKIEIQRRQLCMEIVCLEMFINYFYSIYLVSLRATLNASSNRERQAHLKYVNAYIIEGFKALWGFRKHQKSLWGKLCSCYSIAKNTDVFDAEINGITNSLEDYASSSITDKDERDIAMHYQIDKNGSPLELLKLDDITIENEIDRYEQFSPIFMRMAQCLTDLLQHYLFDGYKQELMTLQPVLPLIGSFDQIVWKDKLVELNLAIDKNISAQDKNLSFCKEQLKKWPAIFRELKSKYKVELGNCKEMLSMCEPMLALSYFSLDLCCALKAYFNATIPYERALLVARLNIICYSIIDRIYGYRDRSNSYWEIYVVRPYLNFELPEELIQMRNVLEKITELGIYTQEKRSSFVHLKKENFLTAIKYLYELNPILEVNNSKVIVQVLPKLQQAVNYGLKQIDLSLRSNTAQNSLWVDKYLIKLAPYRNQAKVNVVYESLLKIKKGDWLDGLEMLKTI